MNGKRIKFIAAMLFCVVVAGTAMLRVNVAFDDRRDDALKLINAETLAQGEGEWECSGSGSVNCNGGSYRAKFN